MAEKKSLSKEESKAIDKVLGEPIFDGFTENVYRIRRNLLAFAVLSIIVVMCNLSIDNTNLPITGLSNGDLYWVLAVITLYHLVHFCVYVSQYWSQWRVRLTGKRLIIQTSTSGKAVTYNNTDELQTEEFDTAPHQATLYSWWKNYKGSAEYSQNNPDALCALFKAGKVPERLKRFDDEFWRLQQKQHFNWIAFEVGLPIVLGIAALIFLTVKILL